MVLELKNSILTLIIVCSSFLAQSQVSGYIYDSESKEPLAFCNIVCKATNIGTTTNLDGSFELNTKPASKLHISFIGYKSKEIMAKKYLGKIYLEPQSALIPEVRVIMKEDPAVILMREVIKQKDILGPKKILRTLRHKTF
tara:strand:- start:9 stop:431 length:423 start_codon:yes stop_codon:yes gene_type:complete